ncbi:MAG: OmpA family protein [Flavobacterium sp.]|nr:OmpA family protein [Flavobacterium sp.]
MKKITLSFLLVLVFNFSFAQKIQKADFNGDKKRSYNKASFDSINKWTLELSVGQSKGVRPYSEGYYSGNPNRFFGDAQLNNYNIGIRHMLTPKFGLKANLQYDKINNIPGNGSLPFHMDVYSFGIQAIINASRLLGAEDTFGRFNFLFHGGVVFEGMKSQTANTPVLGEPESHNQNYGITEYNGGLILGITPEFRIAKNLAVFLDVSNLTNYRQHFNWDGSYSDTKNNLSGQIITTSLGLSFSFGSHGKMHGDWAKIADQRNEEIEALNKRVGDMETLMNDSDKDGVPDYLDQENNSVAGVAVDSRGKMVDINRNGVPDELERYIEKSTKETSEKSNVDMIKRLINEGFVSTYFETSKTQPTDVSTEGIDFILTYLRNNPTANVEIIGHADEIGSTDSNNVLATARAENVKKTLIKAGVSPSRLSIASKGEDSSVEIGSDAARRLVRRVTFRVEK